MQFVDRFLLLPIISPAAQVGLNPSLQNRIVKRLNDVIIPALLQS